MPMTKIVYVYKSLKWTQKLARNLSNHFCRVSETKVGQCIDSFMHLLCLLMSNTFENQSMYVFVARISFWVINKSTFNR